MIDIRTYADDNRAYWEKRAPSYAVAIREAEERDGGAAWLALFEKELAAAFPGRAISDLNVLDVGTGPGFLAVLLAKLGARVTAVDYTEGMLEEAARNAEGLDVRFHRMDAEALGFEDATFRVPFRPTANGHAFCARTGCSSTSTPTGIAISTAKTPPARTAKTRRTWPVRG